jgi:tetratricopeptide (TPR) repeat protein
MKISRSRTYACIFFILLFGQSLRADYPYEKMWMDGNIVQTHAFFSNHIDPVGIYNHGYLSIILKKYDDARQSAKKLRALDIQLANRLHGELYYALEEYAEALPYLLTYLDENNDDVSFLVKTGYTYLRLQQPQKARDFIEPRVDDFDDEVFPLIVARSYLAQKDTASSIEWFEKANAVFPSLDVLWAQIPVYAATKQLDKVRKYGQLMAKNYPGNPFQKALTFIFTSNNLDLGLLQSTETNDAPLQLHVGERLDYEVSWGFFDLGTLVVNVKDTLTYRGRKCFHVDYIVDTAPNLPFFDLHHVYEAYIDSKTMLSLRSFANKGDDKGINRYAHDTDYQARRLRNFQIHHSGRLVYEESWLPRIAVDPMSLLFYARKLARYKREGNVATIIDGRYKYADIKPMPKPETIDVLEAEYEATLVDAFAHFKGIAGMSGDVYGWFIDANDTAVPAIGKLEIFLGNVTLELVKWRKK